MEKNVDDILVRREQAMLANEQIPAQPAKEAQEQSQEPKLVAPEEVAPVVAQKVAPEEAEPEIEQETDNKPITNSDAPIDEYGNPIEKPKMYSEDEVQRMIRERLSRGRHAEQPTQQQVKEAAQDFKADPDSEQPWEAQLEEFIGKTINKIQKKQNDDQWKHDEQQRQAEFEAKFTTGMQKYNDFESVVRGKAITPTMMMAMRTLDNPAAFTYGAAKLHPQELSRIAQIADPYVQAAEIGRLHEKMVKARNTNSKAPAPLVAPKGDVPAKAHNFGSLESRIDQHARSKRK